MDDNYIIDPDMSFSAIDTAKVSAEAEQLATHTLKSTTGKFAVGNGDWTTMQLEHERDSIRRLYKMLAADEKMQDVLMDNLSSEASETTLAVVNALMSVQKAMLQIQKETKDALKSLSDNASDFADENVDGEILLSTKELIKNRTNE